HPAANLPLPRQHRANRVTYFRRAAENRPERPVPEVLEREPTGGLGHRHLTHLRRERRAFGQGEIDELPHLGPRRGSFAHIDERRPGERLVTAVDDGLEARRHCLACSSHYRDRSHPRLVLDVVGITEIAERASIALHALHDNVVVLARGEIAATRL